MFGQGIRYKHYKILSQSVLNHATVISSSLSIRQCANECNGIVGCAGVIYSLNASCAIFDIATVNAAEVQHGFGSEIVYLREDSVDFD